jgi:hypothetical protein
MFAPSQDTVDSVRSWLVKSGIKDDIIVHSDNKGWLAFDIPAWQAEEIFQTEYYEHVHEVAGSVRVGCDEYDFSELCAAIFADFCSDILYQTIFESTLTLSHPVSSYQPH